MSVPSTPQAWLDQDWSNHVVSYHLAELGCPQLKAPVISIIKKMGAQAELGALALSPEHDHIEMSLYDSARVRPDPFFGADFELSCRILTVGCALHDYGRHVWVKLYK